MENKTVIEKYKNIIYEKVSVGYRNCYEGIKNSSGINHVYGQYYNSYKKHLSLISASDTYEGSLFEEITSEYLKKAVKCPTSKEILELADNMYDSKYGIVLEAAEQVVRENKEQNNAVVNSILLKEKNIRLI